MTQHTSQMQMNLANICLIDRGNIQLAVNHALHMASADIVARPGDKGVRKVVVEIEMKPVLQKDTAALDTITHKFKIDCRLPKRVSDEYPMLPMADGTVTFQPNSPGDPRQFGMFPDEQAEAKRQASEPQPSPIPVVPPPGMDPMTGEVPSDDDDEGDGDDDITTPI